MGQGGGVLELPRPDGRMRTARMLSAQAGGVVAAAADRELAAAIEGRWPGTGAMIGQARLFHSLAAQWAVREEGARGLIVVPVGYPCHPDPHIAALEEDPAVRCVLADPVEEVAVIAGAVWGGDRVSALLAPASDADGLMGSKAVGDLPRPLCLLLPHVASMLPPETAAGMIEGYARLLPPGSVIILSWWAPDGTAEGEAILSWWREFVAPAWGHTGASVAGWLDAAGLETLRSPRDVRVRPERTWMEAHYARRPVGRMMRAVARVRGPR
jgi:S-adenosyl methyltransferase